MFVEGVECTGAPPYRMLAAGVARSFQITNLLFDLPVAENLRLAAQVLEPARKYWRPISRSRIAGARVAELLERFGLADKAGACGGAALARRAAPPRSGGGARRQAEGAACSTSRPRA